MPWCLHVEVPETEGWDTSSNSSVCFVCFCLLVCLSVFEFNPFLMDSAPAVREEKEERHPHKEKDDRNVEGKRNRLCKGER